MQAPGGRHGMWISALVTLSNLALAVAIGVRLLWRARRTPADARGPETWLAGYFLCGAFFGSLVNIVVYGSLGPEGLALRPELASRLLTVSTLANGIAGSCVYAFTWRTFRADAAWARNLVAAAVLVFAGAWLYQCTKGSFAVVVVPGPAYWIERLAFCGAFVWAGVESLRYLGAMRRRLRIGLADPMVVNRFALWGIWAVATAALSFSDLVARIAYVWTTGETEVLIVEAAMPIIVVTVAATAVIGAVAAGSLWLTFFPGRRYAAWVASRHAARSARSPLTV